MTFTVDDSNISHNSVTNNGGAVDVIGGVAAQNDNTIGTGTLTISVEKSKLIDNSGSGLAVDEIDGVPPPPAPTVSVSINKSIIAGNEIYGLSATGGALIDVTNPIFFHGVVNIQDGSSITFPDIGMLTSNAHVVCLFGKCASVPVP